MELMCFATFLTEICVLESDLKTTGDRLCTGKFTPAVKRDPATGAGSFTGVEDLWLNQEATWATEMIRVLVVLLLVARGALGTAGRLRRLQEESGTKACAIPTMGPPQGLFLDAVDVKFTTEDDTVSVIYKVKSTGDEGGAREGSVVNGEKLHLSSHGQSAIYEVEAYAKGEECGRSASVMGRYTLTQQVEAPTVTPLTSLAAPATVHLGSPRAGSVVLYTLDGSFPSLDSPSYDRDKGIVLPGAGTYTLKAVATAEGMLISEVTTYTVTLLERAKSSSPSPHPGTYENVVRVTLSCEGTAYYTLDGAAPAVGSSSPGGSGGESGTAHVACGGQVEVGGGPGKVLLTVVVVAVGKANSQAAQYLYTLTRMQQDTWTARGSTGAWSVQPEVDVVVVTKDFKGVTGGQKNRPVRGRLVVLHNPVGHFSIAPPLGGCKAGLALPSETGRHFDATTAGPVDAPKVPAGVDVGALDEAYTRAKGLGCQVVSNAGFFDVPTGACKGNVVTGGKALSTSDRHNVNFGIRNGSFVIGYVSQEELHGSATPFDTLVSGIGWLVRGGQEYLEESLSVSGDGEDLSAQSTGNTFATVESARTVLGHDAQGRLMLLQMEGETWVRGVGLYEVSSFVRELGFYNAINLDGGGSATMTVNHTLVSEPSWRCSEMQTLGTAVYDGDRVFRQAEATVGYGSDGMKAAVRCEKPVASIACVHARMPPGYLQRAAGDDSSSGSGMPSPSKVSSTVPSVTPPEMPSSPSSAGGGGAAPKAPVEGGSDPIAGMDGDGEGEREDGHLSRGLFVGGMAATMLLVCILLLARYVCKNPFRHSAFDRGSGSSSGSRSSGSGNSARRSGGNVQMEMGDKMSSPSPQQPPGMNAYYSPSTSVGYSGLTYDDLSDEDANPFHLGSR